MTDVMTAKANALASAFEAMSLNIDAVERNRHLSGRLGPSMNNLKSSLKFGASCVSNGCLEYLMNQLAGWAAAETEAIALSQSDDIRERHLGNLFLRLKPQYETYVADLEQSQKFKPDLNIDDVEHIEPSKELRVDRRIEVSSNDMTPASMKLDGYELWNAAYELKELSRPTCRAIVFLQETAYKISVLAVGEEFGDIEKLGSVDGMIRNANGVSEGGLKVALSQNTFFNIAAELWDDVEIGPVDHGVVSVLKVDENGLSGLKYDGVDLEAGDLFPCMPSHVARSLDRTISDEGGFNTEATSIMKLQVTPNGIEFDVALTQPDQIFSVSIIKTMDDGKPRYTPVIQCDIPEADEDLAFAVKAAKSAAFKVATRYCRQAEAKGFDQDFTKIRGAENKQEKPAAFTPSSSFASPASASSGIKRPSGLTAPGNTKPVVKWRSL